MKLRRLMLFSILPFLLSALPGSAKVTVVARDPYLGAIVVDGNGGQVLLALNADAKGYPASVLKLVDLLVIQEKIEQGKIHLDDKITITGEAAKVGGSQVYLKEKEVFTVEELLYALMIQSANDAAMALAIYVGGSRDGFVELMNQKAQALGMKSTHFNSVHGLPPAAGQEPDVTTARDLSLLCLELVKHPDVFKYTSTKERGFRNDTFTMRNHNHLLGTVAGCDGFKTGFFQAAGFSICATAQRDGRRVIAIVLGSKDRKVRDAKASELLEKGFAALPAPAPGTVKPKPAPAPAAAVASTPSAPAATNVAAAEEDEEGQAEKPAPAAPSSSGKRSLIIGIVVGLGIAVLFGLVRGFVTARRD